MNLCIQVRISFRVVVPPTMIQLTLKPLRMTSTKRIKKIRKVRRKVNSIMVIK